MQGWLFVDEPMCSVCLRNCITSISISFLCQIHVHPRSILRTKMQSPFSVSLNSLLHPRLATAEGECRELQRQRTRASILPNIKNFPTFSHSPCHLVRRNLQNSYVSLNTHQKYSEDSMIIFDILPWFTSFSHNTYFIAISLFWFSALLFCHIFTTYSCMQAVL